MPSRQAAGSTSAMLEELLHNRNSVRGFLPDPLPQNTIEKLFSMAQQSPSWCNTQPWRLVMTAPADTKRLSEALVAAAKVDLPAPDIDFPLVYSEPYNEHRRQCGGALYGAMGVARDDKAGRYDAWLRNYMFFDAPHVAIVSREECLGEYATLDVGVWLGMFMMSAQSLGIDVCALASVAAYPRTLRELLNIPDEEIILCGIAFGTRDPNVPANRARTKRQNFSANVRTATLDSDG
ncbi:MAG: nitroreductase [Myxococcales bacterium]|nr:nitroreductase [Myxococcales bacterium]